MDKISITLSTLFHDPKFLTWICAIVGFLTAFWHLIYFFRKPMLTEKELEEISPRFMAISAKYQLFMIAWFFLTFWLVIFGSETWAMSAYGGRLWYLWTAVLPSYGIFQGVFALLYGVYPQGKSLSFVYIKDIDIRRVAIIQIVIAVAVIILSIIFFNVLGLTTK